jgi:hypothetical protein
MNRGLETSAPRWAARGVVSSLPSTALLVGLLTACGSSSPPAKTGPKGNVVLRDTNNYTSQSTLTIPVVQTAPGADLDICWGNLSKDILCHALSPAMDIDNVSFLQIQNLTRPEIAAKLAAGQLATSEVKIYRDFHVDPTSGSSCVKLSALSLGTTVVSPAQDYVEGADKQYMVLFSTGTTPGSGSRTMMFIQPVAGSTNTSITAPDGCGILQFSADLTTPQPLTIPVAGPWVIDWSAITHDAMNNTVIFQYIDRLLVGYYAGKTVADLEAQFLDIELIATSLFQVSIPTGARTADLANAKDAGGAAFPGFAMRDGVWAVGLLCSTCQIPAPVALSILQPVP